MMRRFLELFSRYISILERDYELRQAMYFQQERIIQHNERNLAYNAELVRAQTETAADTKAGHQRYAEHCTRLEAAAYHEANLLQ